MLEFIRNLFLAVLGVGMFVWLLTVGAVAALAALAFGLAAYIYLQLVRRGVLHPPAHWARYRQRRTGDEEIIEVEYTVVEEREDKNKKR